MDHSPVSIDFAAVSSVVSLVVSIRVSRVRDGFLFTSKRSSDGLLRVPSLGLVRIFLRSFFKFYFFSF